jgi:hypothetical protein
VNCKKCMFSARRKACIHSYRPIGHRTPIFSSFNSSVDGDSRTRSYVALSAPLQMSATTSSLTTGNYRIESNQIKSNDQASLIKAKMCLIAWLCVHVEGSRNHRKQYLPLTTAFPTQHNRLSSFSPSPRGGRIIYSSALPFVH